jgi:hypothetical protein
MIQYIAIGMIGIGFWMAYEIYRAPMMDENGRITKEGKKLKDLFKKKKKSGGSYEDLEKLKRGRSKY